MKDMILTDYACFTCGSALSLDHGTPDDSVSPGTPRTVYCPECDTEHPHVFVALDAETRERAACAELARAAGCICDHMSWAFLRKPGTHHAGCPVSILAAIEARGRG